MSELDGVQWSFKVSVVMIRHAACGEVLHCVVHCYRFTAADICVGYCVMWVSTIQGGIMMQDYPGMKAYLGRLKTRPAFKSSVGTAREWLTSAPDYIPDFLASNV